MRAAKVSSFVVGAALAAMAASCAIFQIDDSSNARQPPPVAPTARVAVDAGPPPEANSAPTVLTPKEIARDGALVVQATAYLAAFTNADARLTRAGAVVFTSTRDGLPQLYVGDVTRPAEAPRRLPTPNERVASATLTSDERAVLFTSDVGSDESFHVSRIALDGTGLVDLTPTGPTRRNPPLVARDRPDVYAFSAHDPGSAKTAVFVGVATAADSAREAYSDARGGRLSDLSPDGKRALFTRFNAAHDSIVFEIDLATGKPSRLYPPEGTTSGITARYSAAADRVFAATQRAEHHAELVSLDRHGKPAAHYEETLLPHAAIRELLVSPTGDRIAVAIDGGDHDEVRILDAHTLKLVKTVETPLGTALLGAYARDGKRFTLTLSHPDAPTDVYAVNAQTAVVTPLRGDERADLSALRPMKASIESVRAFDGRSIPTNLYLPDPLPPGAKLPVIVSIHGGPAASAHLRWSPLIRFYTSLGYAVVEPNIRGSTGFGLDYELADDRVQRGDALRDVETVNYWARVQPWCDTRRIVIAGNHYGGYVTLLELGKQPQIWRAGLDISGMSDLRTMQLLADQSNRVHDETEFGALGKDDALLLSWSPIKFVGSVLAPVFVYQGARDPITPQGEADQIVKALREENIPVEYMLLPDEGHGLTRTADLASFYARTARFLEEHTGPT